MAAALRPRAPAPVQRWGDRRELTCADRRLAPHRPRAGTLLNVAGIVLITVVVYALGGLALGIDV
jgi:hypothetical protein